jgi:uncharacterized protein (DUF3084 family)
MVPTMIVLLNQSDKRHHLNGLQALNDPVFISSRVAKLWKSCQSPHRQHRHHYQPQKGHRQCRTIQRAYQSPQATIVRRRPLRRSNRPFLLKWSQPLSNPQFRLTVITRTRRSCLPVLCYPPHYSLQVRRIGQHPFCWMFLGSACPMYVGCLYPW